MLNFLIKSIVSLTVHGMFFLGILFLTLSIFGPQDFYREANLPKYGQFSSSKAQYQPFVQLARVSDGRAFCSAFVIDSNYALTAAHCVDPGKRYGIRPILDAPKLLIDTGFRAVGINNRIDVALIMGDFSNFKNLRADFYGFTPTNSPAAYQACGFPYLQKKLTCTRFIPRGVAGFTLAGAGFLIPGMSGGPVLDMKHGHVIGINSSMGNAAHIAPILGSLGAFGIEP